MTKAGKVRNIFNAIKPLILLISLILCFANSSSAQNTVKIKINVPDNISTYSGKQPIIFGMPFPENFLKINDDKTVVDSKGNEVPCQFETAATWTEKKQYIKWLLIDCFAEIKNGKAEELSLVIGKKSQPKNIIKTALSPGMVKVDTGKRVFAFDKNGGNFGKFIFITGAGKEYNAGINDKNWKIELEKEGPVRAVVKMSGKYTDKKGKYLAAFTTRIRLYANSSQIKVFHTFNWLTDDKTTIKEVSFIPAFNFDSNSVKAGLDSKAAAIQNNLLDLKQTAFNTVKGSTSGNKLDGWITCSDNNESFFMSLRWLWQQYPASFYSDGKIIKLKLIGDEKPMSLKATDVAVPAVMNNVKSWNLRIFKDGLPGSDVIYNGHEALPYVSPRGISKTWEMDIWYEKKGSETSGNIKNTLSQHPVLGYADPEFAVKAASPRPASAFNDKDFPEVERALKNSYLWYTREQDEEGDFGVWDYGDLQWMYTSKGGTPIYRYWMNCGKGWSVLPWSLWLRSGDRNYFENGEKNSRHVMDVDTCEIPGWDRSKTDWKLNGGQYHYSAIHWGYGPEVFSYYVDSEYLLYSWYLTGLERAKDCLDNHAEAVARYVDREAYIKFFAEDPKGRGGRHFTTMVKNMCALYQATWDPRLKEFADEILKSVLKSQLDSGIFVHVKTNHYTDETLMIASQVFGWDRLGGPIKRWHDALGDPLKPSSIGGCRGPMSLWIADELYQKTRDKHYLDAAARKMYSQVKTVNVSNDEWNGMFDVAGHEAGPALRDWPIIMKTLQKEKLVNSPKKYFPLTSFFSLVPQSKEDIDAGYGLKHYAMILEEKDQQIDLSIAFFQFAFNSRIKVYDPDCKLIMDEERELKPNFKAAYHGLPLNIKIPADKKSGVYTLVLQPKGRKTFASGLTLKSSTGKVVHYAGASKVHFGAQDAAGQFFFKPQAGEDVSISHTYNRLVTGRIVILDKEGKEVAESNTSGSAPNKIGKKPRLYSATLPKAAACVLPAGKVEDSLYSCIFPAPRKWHSFNIIAGIYPYISATEEEWFDPAKYKMPEPEVIGLK
ncbi:MAG: exo-rhamnogalacturonan lyase family protein [Planctomycetota bacterium]|jgi:hypothetical protein